MSISQKCTNRQILMSTNSSYVVNKIGLENLILLNNHRITRLSELKLTEFFMKMSGYDTLRLVLCKRAILVEGDSNELIVQKAYMTSRDGCFPIQDGIDIISVGTAFLRFIEIADKLHKDTAVITDNDGDITALERKYSNYIGDNKKDYIKISYDKEVDIGNLTIGKSPYNYNTLEPKLLKVNN